MSVEINDAVANLNESLGEFFKNSTPRQVDKVSDATENLLTVLGRNDPCKVILIADAVYLGALLCSCKRCESIAEKFAKISEQYAKQLELVKDKEVWE